MNRASPFAFVRVRVRARARTASTSARFNSRAFIRRSLSPFAVSPCAARGVTRARGRVDIVGVLGVGRVVAATTRVVVVVVRVIICPSAFSRVAK